MDLIRRRSRGERYSRVFADASCVEMGFDFSKNVDESRR